MSLDSYRSRLVRLNQEKTNLERSLTREKESIYRIKREIGSIQRSITRNSNPSALRTKQNQIESKEKQLSNYEKRALNYEAKISDKISEIARELANLEKREEREMKKKERELKKNRDEELRHISKVTNELEHQNRLHRQISSSRLVVDIAKLPEKITILFCATNPEDQNQLRLDEEIRLITRKIRTTDFRDSIEIKSIWAIRPRDLLDALNEHKPTVVQFSGHGSEEDEIVLQDDAGHSQYVSKTAIVEMFKLVSSGTRVVIFSTCFSESQAMEVAKHIDVAIGMKSTIWDEAARIFAATFYSAIGYGKSIKEAFNQAKVALQLENIPQEDIPVLFTRPEIDPAKLVLVKPNNWE
jgi:mRNA-degrading endonuclease RelE of RelBE toxin-antitoxin system